MRHIGKSFDLPLLANMVERGRTPVLSRADLESIGYKLAIFPVTALLASVHAMQSVYQEFQAQGSSNKGSTELYDFADLTKLMGFEAVWEFEKRYAETK
jgi:2-methylisocitrate lyase-like PEP mutase family enzyme